MTGFEEGVVVGVAAAMSAVTLVLLAIGAYDLRSTHPKRDRRRHRANRR